VIRLAMQLACRAAGQRAVQHRLHLRAIGK
jgi:hypothetical protein